MPDQPPRAAERLLRWLAPGRDGEVIVGDLREAWAHRGGGQLWYCLQVLSCIRVRLSPWRRAIPDLQQDLHYSLRVIRRSPGYAVAAMLCLALGIGVNSTVFTSADLRHTSTTSSSRITALSKNESQPVSGSDL